MKSAKEIGLIEVIIGIFVIFVILTLLFPVSGGNHIAAAKRAMAKNDVTMLATAITAFQTEYIHPPPIPSNGSVSGELVTALIGDNKAANPRSIVFVKIRAAEKNKIGGLRDGVFVDPWDTPYQVAIAPGTNDTVFAGTNQIQVHKKVAVWNNPALAPGGAKLDEKVNMRRYVTSWE